MGLGGAFIIVYFNPIIFKYFNEKQRPIVNGLNAICFNVGTLIMMFGGKYLLSLFQTWQNALPSISLSSILMLVLWLIFGKIDLKPNTEEMNINYTLQNGLCDKFTWYFSFTYSGLLAFYIVLFTFYPKAGILHTKEVILFGILGAICGMFYSHKFKQRIGIIRVSGLIQLISASCLSFLTGYELINLISAVSLGFFLFLPMPAFITLAQEQPLMNPQKISVTFSIFWSTSYLFATIIPTIFAKIVDLNNGHFTLAFLFICIILSTFFIGSFLLNEPEDTR